MNRPEFLTDYLSVITGRGRCDGWIELRYRHAGGMRTRFYGARGPHHALAQTAIRLAETHDVYVGCALRSAQRGDRAHIGQAWTLWAECDGSDAHAALDAFEPAPTLLIASGTPGHMHAYWALDAPLRADALEDANRRLAAAVSGDPVCYDAARILRPPGTQNHKHTPPLPVRQIGSVGLVHRHAEILGELPPVPAMASTPSGQRPVSDALLTIPPEEYVPALTGRELGRDNKISCPFHEDRTPSLHVYPSPNRGWYCYGCGRGGSIYDLAAALWDVGTRGSEFLELKHRLSTRFAQA